MQVSGWQCDELTHAAILANNAENRPLWGVIPDHDRVRMVIQLAETIDLPNHPFALPFGIFAFFYNANKLVSKHTVISRYVPLDDLEILYTQQVVSCTPRSIGLTFMCGLLQTNNYY